MQFVPGVEAQHHAKVSVLFFQWERQELQSRVCVVSRHCLLTLMSTSAIKRVTTVKSRVAMSMTMAEPTLLPKNITVAIQPLCCMGESEME